MKEGKRPIFDMVFNFIDADKVYKYKLGHFKFSDVNDQSELGAVSVCTMW